MIPKSHFRSQKNESISTDRYFFSLKRLISYFPKVKKMDKFISKFDVHLKELKREQEEDDRLLRDSGVYNSTSYDKLQERKQFFKQMRCNKILMKICVDVNLAFEKLNGNH